MHSVDLSTGWSTSTSSGSAEPHDGRDRHDMLDTRMLATEPRRAPRTRRVAHATRVIDVARPDEDTRGYAVVGDLLFASSTDLVYQLDDAPQGEPMNRPQHDHLASAPRALAVAGATR